MNVSKPEPSRSPRKNAKAAPTTEPPPKKTPNPLRLKMAQFVVEKYVKPEYIVWPRDIKIAFQFVDRHYDFNFWRNLPVKFMVESMVMLNTQKAKEALKRAFGDYQLRLQMQRSIVDPEPSPTFELGESKVGEDYKSPTAPPMTVLQFCS